MTHEESISLSQSAISVGPKALGPAVMVKEPLCGLYSVTTTGLTYPRVLATPGGTELFSSHFTAGEAEAQETSVRSYDAIDTTEYSGGQSRHNVFFFVGVGGVETFVTWEVVLFKKNNSKADEVLGTSQE